MGKWTKVNGKLVYINEGAPIGNKNAAKDGSNGGKEVKSAKELKSGMRVIIGGNVGSKAIGTVDKVRGNDIYITHPDGEDSIINLEQDGKVSISIINNKDFKSSLMSMRKGEI